MSRSEKYSPKEAIAGPEAYYERAFENYPRPWLVSLVGRASIAITNPNVTFHGSENEHEYFDKIDDSSALVLTFTHGGKKNMHDPISGIVAVFGIDSLKDRIKDTKTWVAIPYLTSPKFGPIIERLGSIPIIRSNDYKKYGIKPSDTDNLGVRDAMIDRSVRHLEAPGSMLATFPAGTKGGTKLREGVGLVLERLSNVTVLPVATNSESQQTSQIPRNLRIAFGDPVTASPGMLSGDYIQRIDESLGVAAQSIE